jgi:Zn finger protein HypA/HybF involved in hydrogenase expression
MWVLNIFKLFTYKCENCSYKGPLIKLSFWSIARFFTGFIIPELIAEHKCPKCGSINIKLIK